MRKLFKQKPNISLEFIESIAWQDESSGINNVNLNINMLNQK
jgi:hypothetical protein